MADPGHRVLKVLRQQVFEGSRQGSGGVSENLSPSGRSCFSSSRSQGAFGIRYSLSTPLFLVPLSLFLFAGGRAA